jgi:hypothetical protein
MAKKITQSTQANKRRAYLTKRALVRATGKRSTTLTTEAMRVKGYIVKAEGNWVVKIHDSGRRERLSRISMKRSDDQIVLD